MPAIHLPRLQQQVESLALHYANPDRFTRQLRDLFTFYGDKTRRPSQKVRQAVGLPIENIPAPVLRQIVAEMTPYAENTPHAILGLGRSLWKHPILEYRLLAILLIGKVPISHAEEILHLLEEWATENQEESLLEALSESSLQTLRQEMPDVLLERIQSWLNPEAENLKKSEVTNLQKLALSALLPYARDLGFDNLPRIYNLIEPFLAGSAKVLRPYLLELFLPLASRSPQEVSFILRTHLEESPNAQIIWLARRTLEALPPENQVRLQSLIEAQKGR